VRVLPHAPTFIFDLSVVCREYSLNDALARTKQATDNEQTPNRQSKIKTQKFPEG
jgi:hypothetical protein